MSISDVKLFAGWLGVSPWAIVAGIVLFVLVAGLVIMRVSERERDRVRFERAIALAEREDAARRKIAERNRHL